VKSFLSTGEAIGTFDPSDEDYKALAKANFGGFKLTVDGLVNRPSALTLKDIRDMPSRTQITRHDCVEGWSAIGKWKGVPLADGPGNIGPAVGESSLDFQIAFWIRIQKIPIYDIDIAPCRDADRIAV
jgi:DMSO/TMAO reductase YedYZ molybdopterin-dependent catalytic subunit